jgi:hypothetical protein
MSGSDVASKASPDIDGGKSATDQPVRPPFSGKDLRFPPSEESGPGFWPCAGMRPLLRLSLGLTSRCPSALSSRPCQTWRSSISHSSNSGSPMSRPSSSSGQDSSSASLGTDWRDGSSSCSASTDTRLRSSEIVWLSEMMMLSAIGPNDLRMSTSACLRLAAACSSPRSLHSLSRSQMRERAPRGASASMATSARDFCALGVHVAPPASVTASAPNR